MKKTKNCIDVVVVIVLVYSEPLDLIKTLYKGEKYILSKLKEKDKSTRE